MSTRMSIFFSAFLLVYCAPQLFAGASYQIDTLKTELIIQKIQNDADNGDAQAQYELARQYEYGTDLEKDPEMALFWYRKAAEGGSVPAAAQLSWIYSNATGKIVSRDYVEAEKWCRIAAEAGHPGAQNRLGWLYELGYGGLEKNYSEALKWYKHAAENGNATGMANIGNMYLNGNGVEKDYSVARQWIEKATELGNAFACSRMGRIYEYGYGVDPSPVDAFKWYMKGAEKGDSSCQHAVAYCLRNGKGCEKNNAAAAEWYLKAINNGMENDWYALGAVFYDLKQYPDAVQCFNKAYMNKYIGAATFLGFCYEKGRGVNRDIFKAMRLYEEDAVAGYADSYYYMGMLYEDGNFLSISSVKDANKAIKTIKDCYKKGEKAGSKKAANRLKTFESKGFTCQFYDKKGRSVTYYKGPGGVLVQVND